jgi:hypothetical protein
VLLSVNFPGSIVIGKGIPIAPGINFLTCSFINIASPSIYAPLTNNSFPVSTVNEVAIGALNSRYL